MFVLYTLVALFACVYCKSSEEYVINDKDGRGYKLMYAAQTWGKARDICAQDGAKLAVPKSEEEFKFIQKIVREMNYTSIVGSEYKQLAWLGINNLENYKRWKNVDGENISDTGYHKWAGHNGQGFSNDPAEPHCAGIDAVNNGLRDYWCLKQQPFICEIQTRLT